jgi:hypothetical protein
MSGLYLFCPVRAVHKNFFYLKMSFFHCSSPEPLSAAGLERKQGSGLEVESSSRGIESFLDVGRHKNHCCGSGSGRIDVILPADPDPEPDPDPYLYPFHTNIKVNYFFQKILICCPNY